MSRSLRALGLLVAILFSSTQAAWAIERLPSRADDRRDSFLDTGHQNMPFQLLGVSIKWDKACRAGKLDECMKLAEAFETGLGDLRPEIRVSLGYYRLACAKGSGEACARAATIIREGDANFINLPMAFQTASRGCEELRSQAACAALGVHYYRGAGATADRARATQLWDAACASGEEQGCRLKAGALFFESGEPAQQRAALPLFEAACKAKRAWGCHGLAVAYREGKGATADAAAAAGFARSGCLEGTGEKIAVCGLHAAYLASSGDKASLNLAERLLDKACIAEEAESCAIIGTIGFERRAGATTTPPEALFYLRRGCDRGSAEGCVRLAEAYERGFEVGRDAAAASRLHARACALGNRPACAKAQGSSPAYAGIDPALTSDEQLRLARAAVEGGDKIQGFNTVVRLMQEGDEEASWLLGGWLYYGLPGVMDTSRRSDGVILIENAARVGHVDAAIWAGMAYWYGDGVAEDRAKGEKYMAIAAQRGSEMAGAIYRSMKAEPERQAMAARQKAMEAAAAQQRSTWQSSWASWTPSFSSPATSSGNWQSFESIRDTSNFNQFISSMSNRTACPSSNPYC
jgi:uncharacterized protein